MSVTSKSTTLLHLVLLCAAAPIAHATSLFGEKTDVTIGAGMQHGQRYAGSAQGQWMPVPVLSVQRGIVFADSSRGAGVQYQFGTGLYVSQSVYYDLGRLQQDSSWRPGSDALKGMGRVPGSLTARTLLVQPLGDRVSLAAETEYALKASAHRARYRVGGELKLLGTAEDDLFLTADIHAGNARFNQAYYGVTPEQAANTGRQRFSADAGINAYGAGLRWEHRFTDHWMGIVQLNGLRYSNEVTTSSLIERRNSVFSNLALAYTY